MSRKYNTIALIVAAGSGARMGQTSAPKAYLNLNGKPLLRHSLERFCHHPSIDAVCVVIHPDHAAYYETAATGLDLPPPVTGGKTRQESVRNGLEAIAAYRPQRVLIHDAARPMASDALIDRVLQALEEHQAAVPVIPVSDTIKTVEAHHVVSTPPRASLAAAQTPQGFDFNVIYKLHQRYAGEAFTDDASLCEHAGIEVETVDGDPSNVKITRPENLSMMEYMLSLPGQAKREPLSPGEMQEVPDSPAGFREVLFRTGMGFDVHAFDNAPAKAIRLGGVDVPFTKKLLGHSDADVVLHALVDALLGAIGAGDIGEHFPPTDSQWKGADSETFVKHALALAQKRCCEIINADITVIAEEPKLKTHKTTMRNRIAAMLELPEDRVNIKATTTEGLGFTGRKEGMAAQAVITVRQRV